MKVSRTDNRQHHIYRHKDPSPVNVRHFNVVSRNYRALQRELASVAESAAIAAASGIDEVQYRTDGSVVLDARIARDLALSSIDFREVDLTEALVDVSPDGSQVTVFVEGEVPVGLMGVFVNDSSPLRVRAEATAFPRLVP